MYNRASLQVVMAAKKYLFFQTGKFNLNIVGVRSTNSQSNSFDDHLLVAYLDNQFNWCFDQYPITTDPGKPWLLKPMDAAGCAVMVPGQYIDVYAIGIHGHNKPKIRQYEALEQFGKINYVRDNNKDSIIDASLWNDPKNIFSAVLKTNIHRASRWSVIRAIETYSAGCQVFQDPADFERFMTTCRTSRSYGHSRFTYTLLQEKDFA